MDSSRYIPSLLFCIDIALSLVRFYFLFALLLMVHCLYCPMCIIESESFFEHPTLDSENDPAGGRTHVT